MEHYHPVFVHFSIALLATSSILYIFSLFSLKNSHHQQIRNAAYWNLLLGTAINLATLISGWVTYNTVAHNDISHAAMYNHMLWAIATSITYTVLTIWAYVNHKSDRQSWTLPLSIAFALALLIITGHKGGELVFKHALGVSKDSLKSNHGHNHGH